MSMDGPSVNSKVLSEIKKERKEAGLNKLINIGSWNLHVVHGALQSATESTSRNLKNIMKGTYQVLKDSPACREDYISITGPTVFLLQFCPTRWVNFSDNRGIDQLALDSIMVVFPLSIFWYQLDIFLTFTFFFLHGPLKLVQSQWAIMFKHLWQFP